MHGCMPSLSPSVRPRAEAGLVVVAQLGQEVRPLLPPPGLARRGFKLGRGENKMIGVLGGRKYDCWLKGAKGSAPFHR